MTIGLYLPLPRLASCVACVAGSLLLGDPADFVFGLARLLFDGGLHGSSLLGLRGSLGCGLLGSGLFRCCLALSLPFRFAGLARGLGRGPGSLPLRVGGIVRRRHSGAEFFKLGLFRLV